MDGLSEWAWKDIKHQFFYTGTLPTHINPNIPVIQAWVQSKQAGLSPFSKVTSQTDFPIHALSLDDHKIAKLAEQTLDDIWKLFGQQDVSTFLINKNFKIIAERHKPTLDPQYHFLRLGRIVEHSVFGAIAPTCSVTSKQPMIMTGHQHYLDEFCNYSCASVPIFNGAGEVVGALDITSPQGLLASNWLRHLLYQSYILENKIISAALKPQQHILYFQHSKELLGNAYTGLMVLDHRNKIIKANQMALKLLNCSIDDVLHHQISDFFPADSFARQPFTGDSFTGEPFRHAASTAEPQMSISSAEQSFSASSVFMQQASSTELNQVVLDKASLNEPFFIQSRDHAFFYAHLKKFNASSSGLAYPVVPDFAQHTAVTQQHTGATSQHTLARSQYAATTAQPNLLEQALKALKVDIPVLITGETGTGKDHFAQQLHQQLDAEMPFISINCGAIPDHLLEAELFGYEGGAFTGAKKQGEKGLIELADQGILFLDEIGDLPLHLQVKILRVLQDQHFFRVGGRKPIRSSFKLLCATHQNLKQKIEQQQFRSDLYYRIRGFEVQLQPLRLRQDKQAIFHSILQQFKVQQWSAQVEHQFNACTWPGNIRELIHVVKLSAAFNAEEILHRLYLPEPVELSNSRSTSTIPSFNSQSLSNSQSVSDLEPSSDTAYLTEQPIQPRALSEAEPVADSELNPLSHLTKQLIIQVLQEEKGNIARTAKRLKISRTTVYKYLDC